mmetsp:Transcript_21609/g.64694  ORF Transcript_21609/g.64694 Transcript_21609/m.64694 type:complete len:251 (+) Transcript_21609:1631-2383(+)
MAAASSPPADVSRHLETRPLATTKPDSMETVMRLAELSKPTRCATAPRASNSLGALAPLRSSKARMTARSMGSSFLSGLEQRRASSSRSPASRPAKAESATSGATQAFSARIDMLAVVSVPVLSEHSVDMAAMSCRAEDDVTTAPWSLAIRAAPSAMVTCSTSGSAMGTAAMMMERHTSTTSCQSSWKPWRLRPSTKSTAKTGRMESMTMTRTAFMTFFSKTETVRPPALSLRISCCEEPISVLAPVLST